ncbi:MAG: TonB family protein [Flavobacterium sp.]|jgi:TonB family protein|uniref:energy transducer TonB n=1 Tax=Flavobacterium sp. TaxID=239 RepID=UPI001B47F174|nr:TonB family protein [Flavobacterium sp.]
MKKYLSILILIGFSCFGQVNSNNSDSDKNDEVISFNKVDQIPIFENCKNEKKDIQRDCVVNFINAHIEKNLKYPEEAKKVNVESKVFCTFIIDEKGKVTITEAKGKPTSFKKAFENEAIRVLNLLPKFIPAKHNNKIVKVQAQYTVEFKLENTGIIRVNETVESYPVSVIAAEPDEEYLEKPIPFLVVEQIPLFENCKNVEQKEQINCFEEEMKKHIEKNLKYPKEAKESKIETRVIVTFEIEKDGKLTNIHTRGRRSEYQSLFEEEAKRIISLLPDFIPATQRKKPVVVNYIIPITFKL